MKKLLSLIILLVSVISFAMGQNAKISGKVIDASGDPVPGAAVMITGTSYGTMADGDRQFVLEYRGQLQTNASLTVSSLGFKDVVIPINGKSTFTITMESDISMLEETVVIGY